MCNKYLEVKLALHTIRLKFICELPKIGFIVLIFLFKINYLICEVMGKIFVKFNASLFPNLDPLEKVLLVDSHFNGLG